jgi:stage III sporulation protein AA
VVDERGEIFPTGFHRGENVDVLTGVNKQQGIECLLRTMGPSAIAVDEISSEQDCDAMKNAGWCGVDLYATAHAGSKEELFTRPIYRKLLEYKLFGTLIIMRRDKTWWSERIAI